MSFDRLLPIRWLLPVLAALLLAGCATGGLYGGGYPGNRHAGGYGSQTLYGTVQHVDPYRNRIVIAQDRGGSRIALDYDRGTRLYYRGRQLPVEGLERGDGIRVAATRSGGRWWAQSIEVVRNVRDRYGRGYGDSHGMGEQVRGEVVHVDPRARIIEIARGRGRYADRIRIRYDARTVVEYRGRRYRPANLERGDIVRVRLLRSRHGVVAAHVWVERDSSWR